jgi:hypothetical protein
MTHDLMPDLVPVLSRGKHRNPRKGACFMEFASLLAGEPWSDHPDCTHPLLAALARDVNDHVSDEARREIAPLAPEVIGLNLRDPIIDALLAREVALAALPIASPTRQRVAAVGLLRCERVLNELEGRPADHVSARVASALDGVPEVRDWARGFCGIGFGRLKKFSTGSAPTIVHSAVVGIAEAAVDPDQRLVDLLRRSIVDCATWMRRAQGAQIAADGSGQFLGAGRGPGVEHDIGPVGTRCS